MLGEVDPEYVRARTALLDTLQALQDQLRALILVGAQAVYLRTGEADLAVAPYTTDADLVLDPAALLPDPKLAEALARAGFSAAPAHVGTWVGAAGIPVDLLVPEALGGGGRRAARLGPHGKGIARKTLGLEAALIDRDPMQIAALDASDRRQFEIAVAGPAALLVAKLYKLAERQQSARGRLDDKDALDVYRLLTLPTVDLASRFLELLDNTLSVAVTHSALEHLGALFGSSGSVGTWMAARAVGLLADPETIARSCPALTEDLLNALRRSVHESFLPRGTTVASGPIRR